MSISTKQWEAFQNQLQHVSEVVSFLINSLLIYLIINKSPKKLGSYKYLMVYISVFELLYAFMDVIVSPFFYSYGPALLVIANAKTSFLGRTTLGVLLSIYSAFFGSSMAIFGIHFIYRYLVASGSPLLSSFSTWKIVLWLSFPVFYGTIWGVNSYFSCEPTEFTNEFIRNGMLENFDLRIEDIAYFGLNFYETDSEGETVIVYKQIVGILINSFIIISSLSTAIYFGVKCYNKINQLVIGSSVSSRNRALQSQLFYALVVQTTIPIILMHIPVSIVYSFAFVGHGMGTICGIVSITISMYPALDPLPTIFIIKNYRNALLNWIPFCRRGKQTQSQTTSRDVNAPNV